MTVKQPNLIAEMKEKHSNEVVAEHVEDSTYKLLTLFIDKTEDRDWAYEEITKGGPPHKQALSALLSAKTLALITATEERTGEKFATLPGTKIMNHKYEEEYIMPVEVVLDKTAVTDLISKAPDHEALVYLMAMQAIDWAARKQ